MQRLRFETWQNSMWKYKFERVPCWGRRTEWGLDALRHWSAARYATTIPSEGKARLFSMGMVKLMCGFTVPRLTGPTPSNSISLLTTSKLALKSGFVTILGKEILLCLKYPDQKPPRFYFIFSAGLEKYYLLKA